MKGIMIQGCTSDAGKSFIATALCRVLKNRGYRVCPYKSQNMSNNSYVTWDGKEIGRAQGVQAEAAGIRAETYMNPILLKPQKNLGAEIVLFGEVYRSMDGKAYQADFTMDMGLAALRKGLAMAEANSDIVVIEGAGSPAEVNLMEREICNMRVAREADVPVLLAVDINRGGAFASIVGTLELLGKDRERVKGLIINQFYGDVRYFEDGVRWLEEYTGIRVCGVLPHVDVQIEGEDSLSINYRTEAKTEQHLDIGIVELPFLSNHTDMEIFRNEEDVSVRSIDEFTELGSFDAVILPGTKSTIGDMDYLEKSGLGERLRRYEGAVFGICGGYQIMGRELVDEEGVDLEAGTRRRGLGLLPTVTIFCREKKVRQTAFHGVHSFTRGMTAEGYEIHLGRTSIVDDGALPLWSDGSEAEGAATADMRYGGSYLHNVFHNDAFRGAWLNLLRRKKGLPERPPVDTAVQKEQQYERLAEYAEKYLDIDYILELIEKK